MWCSRFPCNWACVLDRDPRGQFSLTPSFPSLLGLPAVLFLQNSEVILAGTPLGVGRVKPGDRVAGRRTTPFAQNSMVKIEFYICVRNEH